MIYPGGAENGTGHVEYLYNAEGRLWQVVDKLDSTASPRITTYSWNADGSLASITRPNGTVRTITYDSAGRPSAISESAGSTSLLAFGIAYYPSDEIATLDITPAPPIRKTKAIPAVSMTFDAANRVAMFNGPNLVVEAEEPPPGGGVTPPPVGPDGQEVDHDADGNMTWGPLPATGTMRSYSYDTRNRLTSAGGLTYTYNAEGNRVGIGGAETTSLVVDPQGALPKVLVRTKDGVTTRYVYGVGLQYEVNASSEATYYHYDQNGNTVVLTDQAGAVVDRVMYSSYGTIRYRQGSFDTPFLFGGRYGVMTDSNGLIAMRARYYNPLTKRFLTSDPVMDGLNWYAYAGGNPITFLDPMGTSFISSFGEGFVTGVVAGVVVVGVAAGAVTLGVPAAAVTGGLLIAGVAGGVSTGVSVWNDPSADNIGYNLGSLTGGAVVGGASGKALGAKLSPPGYQQSVSKPTLKAEFDMMWRNGPEGPPSISALVRDFPQAMSTGPTYGGVVGAVSLTSSAVSSLTIYGPVSPGLTFAGVPTGKK